MLNPHGRMAVITFHSLEDRIVKEIFKEVAVAKKVNKRLPQVGTENLEYQLVNRKPVLASSEELEMNNRAHSAKTKRDREERMMHMQRKFNLTGALVLTLFVLSWVFYFASKTYVSSMNLSLSVQESELTSEIAQKEQTVEELQNEVNTLQEKGRLLGMLDNEVSDNENNIYVMND